MVYVVWAWICPSRSPFLCTPMPSCACCNSGMTSWTSTQTTDAGSHCTWTLIVTTWTWVGTVFMTASDRSTNRLSISTLMRGSPARPVMCTGPSSWTSQHAWGPVPGIHRSNVVRPIDYMMKRHQAWHGEGMVALCSKTYYWRDAEGHDKLSRNGLQKNTNSDFRDLATCPDHGVLKQQCDS